MSSLNTDFPLPGLPPIPLPVRPDGTVNLNDLDPETAELLMRRLAELDRQLCRFTGLEPLEPEE